jgi:hypothetical protein
MWPGGATGGEVAGDVGAGVLVAERGRIDRVGDDDRARGTAGCEAGEQGAGLVPAAGQAEVAAHEQHGGPKLVGGRVREVAQAGVGDAPGPADLDRPGGGVDRGHLVAPGLEPQGVPAGACAEVEHRPGGPGVARTSRSSGDQDESGRKNQAGWQGRGAVAVVDLQDELGAGGDSRGVIGQRGAKASSVGSRTGIRPSWPPYDAAVPHPSVGFLVGPGVLAHVDGVRALAERLGVAAINTWGAKGVFRWDSRSTAAPPGCRRSTSSWPGWVTSTCW